MMGRGINQQIRRAYGFLASRYRPGDRIFLMGYSRGAYAVRSLAGMIDRVGLLRAPCATERNIRQTYRLYAAPEKTGQTRDLRRRPLPPRGADRGGRGLGHGQGAGAAAAVPVGTLGAQPRLPQPPCWGPSIRHGFQALALDETREVFDPVPWECPPGWHGDVRQVWFRGTHGDVGGHLGGFEPARPLANIPLVWMLERLEECALPLPASWRGRFPTDADAPSVGTWRGWGKLFWLRKRRVVGRDMSEQLHASVRDRPELRAALGVTA